MPRRVAKRYRFESEVERQPLTPALERRLLKVAVKRADAELREWHVAADDLTRFYAAPKAAMAAYTLGNHALASELANVALSLAPSFSDNWNYGNAIHFAHTALGLVALREGNVPAAVAKLQESGDTPGSPQLNSFGPSMRLARDLLCRGESAPVLVYFKQCGKFWSLGQRWLGIWEKKVRRGATPSFFMQLYR
jgi:hypothetical protein